MRVAIYGRKINKQSSAFFLEVLKHIDDFGWKAVLEEELKEQLVAKAGISTSYETFNNHKDFHTGLDLLISLGGDGTFLRAVSFIRDSGVPIMGINTGRLGFLSNISKDHIYDKLAQVRDKQFEFQKRSLLRVSTVDDVFGEDNFALNELTLQKKDTSSMVTVHAYLDKKFLNSYWADGLIVATPTGSTAYSLSCGGPIITPGCQVHILTPIAPHNLNVRPVVVPDHMPITLSVEGRDRSYLLSLDGVSKHIKQGEDVVVTKAEFMINVVKFEDNNFLDTIRNKMLWGIDTRN
ncbi:MAG: NAD kinase [Crocinitomicaceae bacterium]|nr:NAD kinase [Crocinitomicaceae bacterium]MBP6033328.1 NAD kinase [Crocinitomicaceae bacterium]